jgi:hypothetical protein
VTLIAQQSPSPVLLSLQLVVQQWFVVTRQEMQLCFPDACSIPLDSWCLNPSQQLLWIMFTASTPPAVLGCNMGLRQQLMPARMAQKLPSFSCIDAPQTQLVNLTMQAVDHWWTTAKAALPHNILSCQAGGTSAPPFRARPLRTPCTGPQQACPFCCSYFQLLQQPTTQTTSTLVTPWLRLHHWLM